MIHPLVNKLGDIIDLYQSTFNDLDFTKGKDLVALGKLKSHVEKEFLGADMSVRAFELIKSVHHCQTLGGAVACLIAVRSTILAETAFTVVNDDAQTASLTDTVTKYPALLDKLAQLQRYDIEEMSGNPFASYRCINEDECGDYLRREDVIRLLGGKPDDYI